MPFIYLVLITLFSKPIIESKEPVRLTIVYFSPIDKGLQNELNKSILATYNCELSVAKEIHQLPANSFYKPRNRYRAPVLLENLKTIPNADKVIGITSKDISTTKKGIYDWGVMGLGFCPGKSCVISTFRIKTANKVLFNDRFIKVALHEIGHTFGLPHCNKSITCFMSDANGTVKNVDRESRELCSHCKKLIIQYIKS